MTLAYSAESLSYDSVDDTFVLRADFDPSIHQVNVQFGDLMGWPSDDTAGWNGLCDPSITLVRDMQGSVVRSGHAYVAERFDLVDTDGAATRVNLLEIDGSPLGYVADGLLVPETVYRCACNDADLATIDDHSTQGFGPGTLIATPGGEVPVERLAPGATVLTLDDGPQVLRWLGRDRVSLRDHHRQTHLSSVTLGAEGLGEDGPTYPLMIGPDTHMLLFGPDIALHFAFEQALVRAGDLVTRDVADSPVLGATYFLLLFDRRHLIRANGTWCESLYLNGTDTFRNAGGDPPPRDVKHRAQLAYPCLNDWETRLIGVQRAPDVAQMRAAA